LQVVNVFFLLGGNGMLTKWFGTPTPRQSARESFFRPELEALENRLSPSGMGGGDGGNNVHIMNNIHNNIHINNSFNGANLAFMGFPQSTLAGFFTMLYQQAAAINAPAANALVGAEAQLAVDEFLSFEGSSGLSSTISSLQSSIAANPLESTTVGVLLGDVTFDLVLSSMVSTNFSATI
jgi:hypothetical protein